MSYLRYLCLFVYRCVQHILAIGVTLWVFYERQELLIRGRMDSSRFCRGRVAHRFSFICCVLFCFVCHRPVSCVSNVSSFSG